jgi:glycosyltransferase involved in cell wall biosynthesis
MEWSTGIGDFVKIQNMRVQVREEIRNAAAFNTILVNSLFSRESVLRAYGLESTVCYLGIDSQRFKPTGELPESFVMCLGGLSFQKGADRAIRAIGAVHANKRPDLVWVGNFSSREYESELQKLAADCRVKLTIKVRVSDDELVSMLSRAALLLYTSRLEPFGLSPLEANACGTPVVAIAEGGVRESVVHECNGLLVDGDDPLQLAKAVERLINDRTFSDEMRKRALSHANAKWKMVDAIDRIESELTKLSENSVRMSEHRLVVQP